MHRYNLTLTRSAAMLEWGFGIVQAPTSFQPEISTLGTVCAHEVGCQLWKSNFQDTLKRFNIWDVLHSDQAPSSFLSHFCFNKASRVTDVRSLFLNSDSNVLVKCVQIEERHLPSNLVPIPAHQPQATSFRLQMEFEIFPCSDLPAS